MHEPAAANAVQGWDEGVLRALRAGASASSRPPQTIGTCSPAAHSCPQQLVAPACNGSSLFVG